MSATLSLPDGRSLGYATWGDPRGVPLICFHGCPGSRFNARSFHTPARDAGIFLIAPERPGYGLSSPSVPRRLTDWPADVAALADSLGLDRFHLAGASGGGPHALVCAAKIPQRLKSVTVVNSHLHFDHCGNNALFPDIPIYVQQAELDAAREPHYTVSEWVEFPNAHYVPVQGNHSISDHLELVPTPGHTPGHQSLLLRSGEQVEIIVAQAAYTAVEFQFFMTFLAGGEESREGRDSASLQAYLESNAVWSHESYLASLTALQGVGPQRAFFSHDPVAWERSVAP